MPMARGNQEKGRCAEGNGGLGCLRRTGANATDGPRPVREPAPICVNDLALKTAKGTVATEERKEERANAHQSQGNAGNEKAFSRTERKTRTRSKGESGGIWEISGIKRVQRGHRGSQADVQDHADILDLGPSKILENRDKVKQFIVVCVREPAADGNRVLRVEDVGSRRIINDYGFPEITANLRKVLIRQCQRIVNAGTWAAD